MQSDESDNKNNEHNYLIEMELPGYEKENLKMDIEDSYLTIQTKIDSSKVKNEGSY